MDYTIGQLAELAGVSTRTLRYYDRIGLLKPLYVDDSGYRWYGERELDLLQQILFYRERGFALAQISDLLYCACVGGPPYGFGASSGSD